MVKRAVRESERPFGGSRLKRPAGGSKRPTRGSGGQPEGLEGQPGGLEGQAGEGEWKNKET